MKDYAEAIPEESREEYNQLVSKVFGDDHDAMQQAVMCNSSFSPFRSPM